MRRTSMSDKIVYVGLDVDDKAFHGSIYNGKADEIQSFKCKPTAGALLNKLENLGENVKIKLCYEATYIGYGLCRILLNHDIHCDIIAPSLIPEQRSNRVKTDRTDSVKLAKYYAAGLLTPIAIPDEEDEEVRSLIRERQFQVKMRKKTKLHILSMCRYYGINYKQAHGSQANHWTNKHYLWLRKKLHDLGSTAQLSINQSLTLLSSYDNTIKLLEAEIERLSKEEKFSDQCKVLRAFKGIETLTAMTLIVELGDIRRFDHPKRIVSYCGLDIIEYSSGGKENKYGITKMGNRRMRTALVEACQTITRGNFASKELLKRREGVDNTIIQIAEKCQMRLWAKRRNMLQAQKHNNKIKTACAREMIGFIWEALMKVAA